MQKKDRILLVLSLMLVTAIVIAIVTIYYSRAGTKVCLTVRVTYLLDNSIVTGAIAEIASINGRTVARQWLDSEGAATFQLYPGSYTVRMASGFTGQLEVDLQSDKEVTLKVIPYLSSQ